MSTATTTPPVPQHPSFSRFPGIETWVVRIPKTLGAPAPGDTVQVKRKDGAERPVKAGSLVGENDYSWFYEFTDETPPPVTFLGKRSKAGGRTAPKARAPAPVPASKAIPEAVMASDDTFDSQFADIA